MHKRSCSYVLVNCCPRTSSAVLRAQEIGPVALKRCNQNHESGVLMYSTSAAKNWNVLNILSNTLLPELEDLTNSIILESRLLKCSAHGNQTLQYKFAKWKQLVSLL